jgi:DNA-binding NtrC family response regulator
MSSAMIVLVSSDLTLIEAVEGVISPTGGSCLEVVAEIDRACERVGQGDVSLVLVHLRPRDSVAGLTRLMQTMALTSPAATLVLSDEYRPEQALALLRLGVADYLARPLDLGRLAYLVDVLTLSARRAEGRPAPAPAEPIELLDDERAFVYLPVSRMGRLMEQVRRIAPQDTTILLGGETGTGKTRLAGLIHRLSPRRGKPFLTVNCGALSGSLIESEMFGHAKGAFTGADADRVGKFAEVGRGTLFLDEVDSLPMGLQAKLLRAVEERVFEPVGSNKTQAMQARLIVASNRSLEQEVADGRFRADLFYRLNVVAFTVPPLRDRMVVVPYLIQSFLEEFAIRLGRSIPSIRPEAMRALLSHTWPGNIRELRNAIERSVALCADHAIGLDDLPDSCQQGLAGIPASVAPAPPAVAPAPASLLQSKEEAERASILQALVRNGNNRLRAAAELGISRMTLYKKLHKYDLMFSL